MQTTHTLHVGDARRMLAIADASVHLIVTSPPYPMVEMWDVAFAEMAMSVGPLIAAERGPEAFEAMHEALDGVWAECMRVLVPGGFACINIGDATRTIGGEFCLYPNQSRIVAAFMRLGLTPLPGILWRKPTNAPNKFMGSGMLPAGAYVTYEHEYILIFRKGGKRKFTQTEQALRAQSAFFWEERNLWFSDVWTDLRGTAQGLGQEGPRGRSAAFPFELPYRLVNMYALQGDTVLDPFAGTGTTMAAALAAGRSSLGYERVPEFAPLVAETLNRAVQTGALRAGDRLRAHVAWMHGREALGKSTKHTSRAYGFAVLTRQEVELRLLAPESLLGHCGGVTVEHGPVTLAPPAEPSFGLPPARAATPAERRRRQPPLPLPGLGK